MSGAARAVDDRARALARLCRKRARCADARAILPAALDFGPLPRIESRTMSEGLPFAHPYNLNRLGQAGDDRCRRRQRKSERIGWRVSPMCCRVDSLCGQVELRRLAPNRFRLDFSLDGGYRSGLRGDPGGRAGPYRAPIHAGTAFQPGPERATEQAAGRRISPLEDEVRRKSTACITTWRRPCSRNLCWRSTPIPGPQGWNLSPPAAQDDAPESPFAVLKGLKSGL